jgi:hypothetical protein
MTQEQFKQYQKQLNVNRVNKLNSVPKLSPKVLLGDKDFDVSINDIPMNIKPPVLPVQKEESNKTSKELW